MGKHSVSVWKGKEEELKGIIFRLSLCSVERFFSKKNHSDESRIISKRLDNMISYYLLERFWLFFGQKKLVAEALGVNPKNLYRWYHEGVPSRKSRDIGFKLFELEYFLIPLMQTFKPECARKWLLSPLICFDNERPIDLIRKGRITEVTETIGRIAHGIMS